jgi:CRISPR system Cascade subunit CasE
MYLTRLTLNPRSSDARRDLSSPYDMHRTLKRAFSGTEPEDNRLLFRIEPNREDSRGRTVLVQTSTARPDWSFLDEPPFADGRPYTFAVRGPKAFDVNLSSGQQLAFRLLGNPTKKSDGSRYALTDEEDYEHWLHRKGRLHGFEVLQASMHDFWINGDQAGKNDYSKGNIPHFAVRYEGHLRVADAKDLEETVASGVGPAKAFGFGLLSLARTRSRGR